MKATQAIKVNNEEIRERLFHSIAAAAMFVFIGFFLPKIAYRYMSATYFYEVSDIQILNQGEIYSCGEISYSFVRTSRVATDDGHSTTEIVRLFNDQYFKAYELSSRKGFQITPGKQVISHVKNIPCETEPGEYFLSGTTSYDLQGEAHKTTYWTSDEFQIKQEQKNEQDTGETN